MHEDLSLRNASTFLLGQDKKQRLRALRSLMSASVYLICLLLQGYACWAGFMKWDDAKWLSGVIVLNMLFWYGVIRSGQNLRFNDPSLTLPQMLTSLGCIAWAYAITGPVHGATMMLLTLVMVFGIFNMSPRDARITGLCTIGLMGTVIVHKMLDDPHLYPARVEFAHFVLIIAIVPTISSLASQMSTLRTRLQQQKEELHEAFERIQILATRDELTGLFNRRHMMDIVTQHQKRLARTGHHRYCLAIVDLDHFKRINDTYGHAVGDEVLSNFAKAARDVMRDTDVLARWGGEEFLMLLNDSDLTQAQMGIERIRLHLSKASMVPSMPELIVTFSAGVSAYRIGETIHGCIERADQALYEAKASGRNCTRISDAPALPVAAYPKKAVA